MTLRFAYKTHLSIATTPFNYEFEIEIIDTCLNDAIITPSAQTDPAIYYYTGPSPAAVFSLAQFTVYPDSICTVLHTCTVVSGPQTDLCTINEAATATQGIFDPATGGYTFEDSDATMTVAPPGEYVFEITATVGATQSPVQFKLTLANPCQDQVTLSIPGPHFAD